MRPQPLGCGNIRAVAHANLVYHTFNEAATVRLRKLKSGPWAVTFTKSFNEAATVRLRK